MSLSELGLILIIALFVLKPSDMKAIGKFIKNTMDYFASFKRDLWKMLDEEEGGTQENTEQINRYLEKIIKISGRYEGEYDLGKVKAYYHKLLIKEKLGNDLVPPGSHTLSSSPTVGSSPRRRGSRNISPSREKGGPAI